MGIIRTHAHKALHKPVIRQGYRFLIIGAASTVINMGVFNFMVLRIHTSSILSSILGYILGFLFGYLFNKSWTFSSKKKNISEPLTYFSLYFVTLLVNMGLVFFFEWLSTHDLWIHPTVYYIVVTAITTLLNFVGCKYVVFRYSSLTLSA